MNTPTENTPDKRFYYADGEQSKGPVSLAELHRLATVGQIAPQTFVIPEGGSDWVTYADVAARERLAPPPLPPSVPNNLVPKARRWPAVICTIILYPFGLIALWLSKGYNTSQKWILTGTSLGVFVGSLLLGKPPVFAVLVVNSVLFIWWARSLAKVWKVALCVLVSIFFLPPVFLMQSNESGPVSSEDDSVEASSVATPASKQPAGAIKANENSVKKRGEIFRLGDFSYQIIGSRAESEIGRRPFSAAAGMGGTFLIVKYAVTNESNKTRTVISDDFVLRDGKGREYSPSSKALTALMASEENKDFLLSELQPGLQHVTLTAFEIPNQLAYGEDSLTIIVPEKGWGGKRVEVILRKGS